MERPAASQLARADLVVAPDVAGMSFSDFSHAQAAYEAGVKAGEDALPALRGILARL